MDTTVTVICPNCGFIVFVDKSEEYEVEDWGLYSAECVECGSKFRKLERQPDGSWISEWGEPLELSG
jgi:hypothetical protein